MTRKLKKRRHTEKRKQQANNEVSPQRLNMRCDEVDQIPARKFHLLVCEWNSLRHPLEHLLVHRGVSEVTHVSLAVVWDPLDEVR